MAIFVEMVQKRRLQQGFCQNHARTSYSWSPIPGRAGFSSIHWILWAKPKLWQTCPTWGLFLGSQKQAFLASSLWALIVYLYWNGASAMWHGWDVLTHAKRGSSAYRRSRHSFWDTISGGQAPPSQTHDPLKISITNAQSVCEDCRWMSLTNENSICNVSLSQWYSYISAYMIRNV